MSSKEPVAPGEFTFPSDTSSEHVLAFRIVATNLILFLIGETESEERAITFLQTMSAGPETKRNMLVYEYANGFEKAIAQSLSETDE